MDRVIYSHGESSKVALMQLARRHWCFIFEILVFFGFAGYVYECFRRKSLEAHSGRDMRACSKELRDRRLSSEHDVLFFDKDNSYLILRSVLRQYAKI